jgi:hypothetical protein
MILFISGILMIVASLIVQVWLASASLKKASEKEDQRPTRRVKGRPSIRSGPVDRDEGKARQPQRATKLPVKGR